MGLFDKIDDPSFGAGAQFGPFSFMAPQPDPGPPPIQSQAPMSLGAPMAPPAAPAAPPGPVAPPPGLLDPQEPPQAQDAPRGGLMGLLSRVTAPDAASGLTFGDKLFAIGSSLRGDTEAVGKYLTARQAGVAKQKADADKLAAAKRAGADLAAATDKDGHVDIQKYFQLRAAANEAPDDKVISAIYAHNIPENVLASAPRGGYDLVNKNARPGQDPVTFHKASGPKELPFGWEYGPDGETPQLVASGPASPAYKASVAGAVAAARAAHPMPSRAKGPKRLSFDPSEVH